MPKKRPASPETYDSDNGFVEDAPKSKKSKTKNGASASSGSGASTGKDGDGGVFWEVS